MKLIYTSAAAYELEADYYLTALTLRRNPKQFRMKNVSRKKGNNEIEQRYPVALKLNPDCKHASNYCTKLESFIQIIHWGSAKEEVQADSRNGAKVQCARHVQKGMVEGCSSEQE